jgi:enterochelin esterase-like enzyme
MPNGVPYDGSSYNNDLGPGAYPANITHGTYFSSVVNAVTGYSIYLPPEYATNPNQRFNVIYFLTGQGFGSGATENSEVTADPELISNLRLIPPTIMVFPNPYQNSKYMDATPGSSMSGIEMFESQFINELIPFIDANYRTRASRGGRAIMGFSGGGQGALRLAFKYPALFSSVEGMSGAVDDNASNVAVNEPQLLAAMFNGDANAFDAQTANGQAKADRASIIASALAIHMSVGSADSLLPDNRVLDALLTSLGIPHDPLEVIPGGIHDPRTIFNSIGPTPFQFINAHFLETTVPNPRPPTGTTADMVLRGSNAAPAVAGQYEIHDIGSNSILATCSLGQVGTDWQFAGLGGFFGSDTTDMLLRSATTGGFEVYDIANNNITNAAFLGTVGMDWQVMGFGNFSSMPGENDMILRNSNTGGVQVYDIANNQITGAAFMGTVGLNWQFSGVGNFSSAGESDMLLRNSNTGGLEVYDIANNAITGAAFIGTVGLDWRFSGVGNFSSVPGETDLLLRNVNTGGLEVYDINNNQITGAAFLGTVGLDWQFAGIAPIHAPGASDLVLRNVNSGAFEVYDIANNQLTGAASLGAVGTDWQLGGFAADPPTGSMGDSSQSAQLVQAMAGFGGGTGAAEGLNAAPLSAETSQQPLLTTSQHA